MKLPPFPLLLVLGIVVLSLAVGFAQPTWDWFD